MPFEVFAPGLDPPRLWVTEESEVERYEDQDDAGVDGQPLQCVASEEHDVDADNDSCHHDHVERGSCRASHAAHVTGAGARPLRLRR
jgi:hypothetical protein